MEMNLWNEDFLLASEWGLDLPLTQPGLPLGDLKPLDRLDGDAPFSFRLRDAVEPIAPATPSNEDDFLGLEWMESTDLGSYLDALGSSSDEDQLLPLEASLMEFTASMAPDEPAVKEDGFVLERVSAGEVFGLVSNGHFDALVGSPGSPEQVTPVIKIETVATSCQREQETPESVSGFTVLADDMLGSSFTGQDFILGGLEFSRNNDIISESSVVTFDDASELINSPLSVDDVESTLSMDSSAPTSPASSSYSSIIQSSPELFKVISSPSVIGSSRFAPYSRPKSQKNDSNVTPPRKTRRPAEPVPDHVILEQLDKKDRKKLQNKNAAIRYRQKKKEEASGINSEERELEDRNTDLKSKVEDLKREIQYMKKLMEDVCKAKGLL